MENNNHKIVTFETLEKSKKYEIFAVFKLIGEIAEGSYGIIYLYNDEDTDGKENYFQVFSLARGMIKENLDEFLSPIIPTIEDRDSFDV